MYYTSDTHKIVVGGNVYCDIESIGEATCGEIIADIFGEGDFSSAYEFAADTSGQADWDTSKIYYVPSSTAGMYNIYSYTNGAWSYTQSSSSPIPAANVSYDKTNTPDLGNGNVQSAIEALNAKAVTESTDSQSGTFKVVKLHDSEDNTLLPMASSVHKIYQYFSKIKPPVTTINFASTSAIQTLCNLNEYSFAVNTGKTYIGVVSFTIGENETIGAGGTLKLFPYKGGTSSTNLTGYSEKQTGNVNLATSVSVGNTYYAFVRFTAETQTAYFKIICTGAGSTSRTYNMTFNFVNVYECDDNDTAVLIQNNRVNISQNNIIFDTDITANLEIMRNEYYQKGVADGSGMASIAGLGYNIYDYISGAVDLDGFEYGCEQFRTYNYKPTVSLNAKWSYNTSLVYFPKFDMTGLPSDTSSLFRFLQHTNNLKYVPDLTFASGAQYSLSEAFQYSGVVHVGSFINLKITNVMTCFKECRSLLSVGNLDTSLITTWRTGANQIFTNTNTDGVKRVESLDFTSTTTGASMDVWISNGNMTGLRYIVIKNIGTASGCTSLNFTRIVNWGIPHASYPSLTSDARQSLIDTLLTYSFDRATAGYSACTVTLSAATKALLTDEEIEQITAKGYTIA